MSMDLLDCKVRPMTDEESRMFINLTFSEMDGEEILKGIAKDLKDKNCLSYQILDKRLETFKKHFSPDLDIGLGLAIFCSMLCENPAMAVQWAFTLNEMWVKSGEKVTLKLFAEKFFQMGVPTEEEYNRKWGEQKKTKEEMEGSQLRSTDNRIDDFQNWTGSVDGEDTVSDIVLDARLEIGNICQQVQT